MEADSSGAEFGTASGSIGFFKDPNITARRTNSGANGSVCCEITAGVGLDAIQSKESPAVVHVAY